MTRPEEYKYRRHYSRQRSVLSEIPSGSVQFSSFQDIPSGVRSGFERVVFAVPASRRPTCFSLGIRYILTEYFSAESIGECTVVSEPIINKLFCVRRPLSVILVGLPARSHSLFFYQS